MYFTGSVARFCENENLVNVNRCQLSIPSALAITCAHISRFCEIYSWNQKSTGLSPPGARITSSNVHVVCDDRIMVVPRLAAALAISISPSPPTSLCIALGEIPIGIGYFLPNIVVLVST